jgi:uncharacterized protein YjbI with pentapeptide repeats
MKHQFDREYYENESFTGISVPGGEVVNVEFENCVFRSCVFCETTLRSCRFRGCRFEDCDLNMIKVPNSVFIGTDFENCKLMAVDWTRASWGRKDLFQLVKSIHFFNCVLNFSVFIGLELKKIRIEKCIAREVDFSDTDLEKANFKGTDLEKAIFRNTKLAEANFVGAQNYFIPAQNNELKGARFSLPEAMALLYGMEIVLEREGESRDWEPDPQTD